MNRLVFALFFVFATAGLALFLWQKQYASYNFSLDKEKNTFKGLKDTVQDFEQNLPDIEPQDELLEALRKYQSATSTPEGQWPQLFEELNKLEESTTTNE